MSTERNKAVTRRYFEELWTQNNLAVINEIVAAVTTGMNLFRLAGGKIAELWVESDDLGELQQLGVVTLPK